MSFVDRVVADSLFASDLPNVGSIAEEHRTSVVDFATTRIATAPDTMRLGIRLAAAALFCVLAATGVRVGHASPARMSAGLCRARRLPGIGDYVRLVRALVLVGWYDAVSPEVQ